MIKNSQPLPPQILWGNQLDNLRRLGYQLPAYDEVELEVPLPDEKIFKIGPALLVDYGTPIDKQCQLLGIKNYLNLGYHKDLHPKPQGRWGWIYRVEDGKKMIGKSPNQAIEEFGRNNRRGLMTVEGLALYRENADLLKNHVVDLSVSRYDKFGDYAPLLYLRDGMHSLGSGGWASLSHLSWGSASCTVE